MKYNWIFNIKSNLWPWRAPWAWGNWGTENPLATSSMDHHWLWSCTSWQSCFVKCSKYVCGKVAKISVTVQTWPQSGFLGLEGLRGEYLPSVWQVRDMCSGSPGCRCLSTHSWPRLPHTTHSRTSYQRCGSGCSRSGPLSSCTVSLRGDTHSHFKQYPGMLLLNNVSREIIKNK